MDILRLQVLLVLHGVCARREQDGGVYPIHLRSLDLLPQPLTFRAAETDDCCELLYVAGCQVGTALHEIYGLAVLTQQASVAPSGMRLVEGMKNPMALSI
jgi:hypothetical protein